MKAKEAWHICFLADASSVHTRRWARYFAQQGHRVTIITFIPYEIEDCEVIYISPRTKWTHINYLVSLPEIYRIIHRMQPNILHAHYATSYGFMGSVANFHPYVVTAWGTDVLISPKESFIYRFLIRWVFKRSDLVTSMADHMTTYLVKHHFVDPSKVITVPFGVETKDFHPGHRKRPHDGPPFLVLSTRRLDTICDVQTFIRASALVLKQMQDVSFIVGSDGPLKNELKALAVQLGVNHRLSFVGWVPYNDLLQLYGEADVLVSTAVSDGNNVTLNEAMACGAFPVATDIPANRQWLVSGENGLLFPPSDWTALANCIVKALENSGLRNDAVKKNWEIVQQRASWQKSVKGMEENYKKLLEIGRK